MNGLRLLLLVVCLCLLLLSSLVCHSKEIKFSWLPNSEAHLQGYRIHIGDATGVYFRAVDVGLPATVGGRVHGSVDIAGGQKYFACTAYAADDLESDYSDELITAWMPIPAITVVIE